MPRIMRRFLRLLAVLIFLVSIVIGWFWWTRPTRVDMTAYVPADSLVFIESNSLLDLATAISTTDAWQKLGPQTGLKLPESGNNWSTFLARYTGLGSAPAVIATRAQVAFVMLDLTSSGDGDSLEYKSDAALIIETHTSQGRVQTAAENLLRDFATRTYGQPRFEHVTVEGYDAWRWLSPDGLHRIVAAVDGSVVIIGNGEKALGACLSVHRGQRPSLFHRPEVEQMRSRVNAGSGLVFGYVSTPGTTKLISALAPMLLGPISEREEFQRFLTSASSKLLESVGWSAHAAKGGIEDTYFLGVKSELVTRLRPAFTPTQTNFQGGWEFVPPEVSSVTTYNLRDPTAAWELLLAGISSQLDVVSAVMFTTSFRALLTPYGIDDPTPFLKAVKPDLLTVRLDSQADRAVLIAGIASQDDLRKIISRQFGPGSRSEKIGDVDLVKSEDEEFAAAFAGDYFLLGAPDDVKRCLTARSSKTTLVGSSAKLEALTHYFEKPSTAIIITFAKDGERARALLASLAAIKGAQLNASASLEQTIEGLPYAVTETTLGDGGFEKRTRSDFGQFGFLISYLAPKTGQTNSPSR